MSPSSTDPASTGLPLAEPGLLEHNDLPAEGTPDPWASELEIAVGGYFGFLSGLEPLIADRNRTPREAMESVVLPALSRPPCVVTFSGGRDSSVVLAIAADVARREGLSLPIPATNRFPAAKGAQESEWQEQVVTRLGLPDWQRFEWSDELDVVGPYAQRVLRTIGLPLPFNRHFSLAIIDAARGGSMLTGVGGDELFTFPTRKVANRVRYGSGIPQLRELPGFVAQQLPRPVRKWRDTRRATFPLHWLNDSGVRELTRMHVEYGSRVPVRYDRCLLEWRWPARDMQLPLEQFRRLGQIGDVHVAHPFASRALLASYAGTYGAAGPAGRTRAMQELAGDLLDSVLSRTSKAYFDGAFSNTYKRRFVESGQAATVRNQFIDRDVLLAEWRETEPHAATYSLMQSALSRLIDTGQHRVKGDVDC